MFGYGVTHIICRIYPGAGLLIPCDFLGLVTTEVWIAFILYRSILTEP